MSENEQEYDVVVDVLTKHIQTLWEMTERNMQSEYVGMNIMDDIRLNHIREMNQCIGVWKQYKNRIANPEIVAGYTDGPVSDGGMDPRNE